MPSSSEALRINSLETQPKLAPVCVELIRDLPDESKKRRTTKRAAIFVGLHRASEPFRGRSPQYVAYVGTLFRSPGVGTLPCSERGVSAFFASLNFGAGDLFLSAHMFEDMSRTQDRRQIEDGPLISLCTVRKLRPSHSPSEVEVNLAEPRQDHRVPKPARSPDCRCRERQGTVVFECERTSAACPATIGPATSLSFTGFGPAFLVLTRMRRRHDRSQASSARLQIVRRGFPWTCVGDDLVGDLFIQAAEAGPF